MPESAPRSARFSPRAESRTRADGIAGLVETAFLWLARARSARAFHPVGAIFSGTVAVQAADSRVGGVLGGRWAADLRASKAIGTPPGWPDFRGLAVRIHHGEGPIDLLFTTVSRRVPYLLAPSMGWCTHPYTTLLPYTVSGERVIIRLEPVERDAARDSGVESVEEAVSVAPLTFAILESSGLAWREIGRLALVAPAREEIAFDPVINQHPQLCHSRLIAGLRLWAYVGSRRGRGATIADVDREPFAGMTRPVSR